MNSLYLVLEEEEVSVECRTQDRCLCSINHRLEKVSFLDSEVDRLGWMDRLGWVWACLGWACRLNSMECKEEACLCRIKGKWISVNSGEVVEEGEEEGEEEAWINVCATANM